jgi:hypothetical protein
MKYSLVLFLLIFCQLASIILNSAIDDNEFAEFEIADELEMFSNSDTKKEQKSNDQIKTSTDEIVTTVYFLFLSFF